jgi:hypothetical protein
MTSHWTMRIGVGALAAVLAAGCNSHPASNTKAGTAAAAGDHEHGVGPHGGTILELGGGKYHGEFTVDHKKQEAAVYILRGDAKTLLPIKADKVLLSIKDPSFQVELKARPEKGDAAGQSSCFAGTHEKFGKEQEFAGTVSCEIDGKPFTGDFAEKDEGHPHPGKQSRADEPKDRPAEREAALFLTPGGIYTVADIAKNGKVVPSVKFQGMAWAHEDDLKPGDKVCPVTANKADPQCEWFVNGQKYEFCCPPCLEKFIGWAKTQPEKVKPAEQYVK